MKPYRGFGDLITEYRHIYHLRQADVAAAVGWSVPYLSELERGLRQPPPPDSPAMEPLAKVLRLDLKALRDEAAFSRRSVVVNLEGYDRPQRQAAVLFAERMAEGLTAEQAYSVIAALLKG
jgi:transcriptional regulator with XRE-family HTH domain